MKPPVMSPNRIFLYLVIFTFLCLPGCQQEQPAAPEKVIRPVRYTVLKAVHQGKSRTFSGTAVSSKHSALSFKVEGTMKTIHVKVGDRVTDGTVLAELDTTDLQVDLEAARASLKSAEADAKAAQTNVYTTRSNYGRIEKLYESDNVSLSEFEQARGDYNTAVAQLQAAEFQVTTQITRQQAAENQLQYTRLTAPFKGVINAINTEENEEVAPGTPIISLSDLGKLEVTVNLSDRYISNVKIGMPCTVSFPALPNTSFKGVVSEVPYATSEAPTYPAAISLQSQNDLLRPGMAAEVLFNFGATGEGTRLYLSPDAVGEDSNGNFVFFLEKGSNEVWIALKRKIAIGGLTEKGFLVEEGLAEGDHIATSGLQILLDGMEVKLMQEW